MKFSGLCADCSYKLNYKHKKKEIKKKKLKRKHDAEEESQSEDETNSKIPKTQLDQSSSPETANITENEAVPVGSEENNIWTTANQVVEEKSREEDFEDFLEQLLL